MPTDDRGVAGLFGAIYDALDRRAEQLPGVAEASAYAQQGSQLLHDWAAASGNRDQRKSREMFARLYDFAVPQDAVGTLLAAIPVARPLRAARNVSRGRRELQLAEKLRNASTDDAVDVIDELQRGGFLGPAEVPVDAEVQRELRRTFPVAGPERRK